MNTALERFLPMAAFLAETLPEGYEIRVFDCTEKGMSIVRQFHTKRGNEDAIRKFLRTVIKNPVVPENGMLTNRGELSRNGKLYKTSFFFIKDDDGKPVGALALSLQLNEIIAVSGILNSMLALSTEEIESIGPKETLAVDEKPTLDTIARIVSEETDVPQRLTPEEKMAVIVELYDAGVFDLKGAVAEAAEVLHMSEQSVYRYLSQIRRMRGE